MAVEGKMIAVQKGNWLKNEEHDDHWPLFMKQLNELDTDMSMKQFLDEYFNGDQYKELRKAVQNFAEGFDLADMNLVSAFSLRKEWNHEDEQQFRIEGGYGKLVDWLLKNAEQAASEIYFSTAVEQIELEGRLC